MATESDQMSKKKSLRKSTTLKNNHEINMDKGNPVSLLPFVRSPLINMTKRGSHRRCMWTTITVTVLFHIKIIVLVKWVTSNNKYYNQDFPTSEGMKLQHGGSLTSHREGPRFDSWAVCGLAVRSLCVCCLSRWASVSPTNPYRLVSKSLLITIRMVPVGQKSHWNLLENC